MTVINASRMSNRRVLQTLRLRLCDMGKLPAIVREVKELLLSHEALDPRQHRLVFFREVGPYSLDLWVSCFTKSVFLTDYLTAQQEVLFGVDQILVRQRRTAQTPRRAAAEPPPPPPSPTTPALGHHHRPRQPRQPPQP